MKRTPRGFAVYGEYKDSRGGTLTVQESSAVGGPYVWLFFKDSYGREVVTVTLPGVPMAVSPHLTRAQARRVAKALLRFADGGGK